MPSPVFRAAPVRVRVPATSANLGPGFDSLGLALGLYDEVMVRIADAGLRVDVAGEGADTVARDEGHLVVRAMRAAFDRLGARPPGLELVCANRIPHARGLGSSAAAICAGIVAARALTVGATLSDEEVLQLATELEGHPDNVAACLRGGFTIAWLDQAGEISDASAAAARALRVDPAPAVRAVALVPDEGLSTEVARGLLPKLVPHADAARTAGRAALLTAALTAGRADLLLAATQDHLHQGYRAPAMPASAELIAELRAAGHAAVVSGAGPTVLVLTTEDQVQAVIAAGEKAAPAGWQAFGLAVDLAGAVSLSSTEGAGRGMDSDKGSNPRHGGL
ncbi:homoserine kinase [Catenulispora rubra]|uniref:homoserine kinase n=1 Tax=Catenulispora rubra TaxID=280293 RepID=UPI0018920EE5|nr:homoserine kinase [Catenulispora rubra]